MASIKISGEQDFQKRLRGVLAKGLETAGIKATIHLESIPHTKLTRVQVVSALFKQLRHSERQDLVWRIINQHFTPEQQLRISTVMTVAPRELSAA